MTERRIPNGLPLRSDPAAESADSKVPAFLARPAGAPVYHGFPLVEDTRTDGWCYGAVTAFEDPEGCEAGDGFVETPDGSRAGLVWSVGSFPVETIVPPSMDRWGVYAVAFPHGVRNTADLVACFRAVLPELRTIYSRIQKTPG